jgi:hypothetical protein
LAGSGTTTLPASSPEVATLAPAAATLGDEVPPLAITPPHVLSHASSVLSALKPQVVVDQVLNIATDITSINYTAILNDLALLPRKVDVAGAHQIAGDLNNQFAPIVKMVAGVDLTWVSQILSAIPDPTGTANIAAVVCNLLSGVDIIAIADNVGEIQEITGQPSKETLPHSPVCSIGLDLASAETTMLTGKRPQPPYPS